MRRKFGTIGTCVFFIWNICFILQTKAAEPVTERETHAGFRFIANPKYPLPSDELETSGTEQAEEETIKFPHSGQGRLPQTGEKDATTFLGTFITTLCLIIWFIRRKLLKNNIIN